MADYDAAYWNREVEISAKALDKFHIAGRNITEFYLSEASISENQPLTGVGATKVNMFWANIGILKAALYGNPPKPTAAREFQDPEDDVGRVAASMMERMLLTGHNGSGKDMHIAFEQAVEDRLIPGMGQVWLRYDALTEKRTIMGIAIGEAIIDENVLTDYVHWQDFFFSPARIWAEVTWVGRRVWMTKAKFVKRFGEEFADKVSYVIPKDGKALPATSEDEKTSLRRVEVYELFCKDTRKVHWIAKGLDEMLDEKDDFLKLPNFFPCPKPLIANTTNSKFVGRADYTMVQDQYRQLEELNVRIGFLIQACKLVGVVDKTADGVQKMLKQGFELDLVPVDNWAMFAEKGGIKGVIDWLPIEQIAAVIEQLRLTRIDCVQQIYELTGISDIMRGVTNARETYGAQQLKAQYSSSRLQLYQLQVGAFVAEAMEIKAWIISKHFQKETIIKKSLVEFTPDREFAQAAVDLIKNSWQLMYRINVSSTQMSIPDYNAEKQARQEYITSMGQYIAQVTPLVEQAPEAGPFLLKILQWGGAAFQSTGGVETLFDNFVREIEKKLAAPKPPPQPNPDTVAKLNSDQQLAKIDADLQKGLAQIEAKLKVDLQKVENASKERINRARIQADKEIASMKAGGEGENAVTEAMDEKVQELTDLGKEQDLANKAHTIEVQKVVDNALLDIKNLLQTHEVKVAGVVQKAQLQEEKVAESTEASGVRSAVNQIVEKIKGLVGKS